MNDEQYEAVLGVKETLRQFRQFVGECGEKTADDLLSGRVSLDPSQVSAKGAGETVVVGVRQMPGISFSTSLEADRESYIEDQGSTIELLASNAQARADAGLSKEQWISEVLNGHTDDDEAQIGCLLRIAELWKNGPWPWPRSATWEEQTARDKV
jgi:hypothetical protein